MKKIIASLSLGLLLFGTMGLQAQLRINSEGLFIQGGTVFSTDGLTLVPANNWVLNNLSVNKQQTVVIFPKFNSIQRMYRFSRPAIFQGELAMSYEDIELNGNEAKNLLLAYSKNDEQHGQRFHARKRKRGES
jgi:hypothetical protein